LANPDATAGVEGLIERQLKNADLALGNRTLDAARQQSAVGYDPALLNVESRFDVPRIVQALQARGHGSLCFFGPPGSGKTALAEHIALTLGQSLIVRQASDLMGKYVGETEQNMAAMFREAEAENGILLLDEADSFLMDRRGAQRNYEVTEVNEMLQGMERFKGIFICTTNLIDRIDQAALRRFTFKIQFKSLTRAQRETLFATEVWGGDATQLLPADRARLGALDQLCLGDFAAVKRQGVILDTQMDSDEFLTQLEAEHRIKPEVREARGMGFF
jgi:SpoVK/Ycf46/Vps4 family AAA+-type ATPase